MARLRVGMIVYWWVWADGGEERAVLFRHPGYPLATGSRGLRESNACLRRLQARGGGARSPVARVRGCGWVTEQVGVAGGAPGLAAAILDWWAVVAYVGGLSPPGG